MVPDLRQSGHADSGPVVNVEFLLLRNTLYRAKLQTYVTLYGALVKKGFTKIKHNIRCLLLLPYTPHPPPPWNEGNGTTPSSEACGVSCSLLHSLRCIFKQEVLLESQGNLLDTPFTYKGMVNDSWLLTEDLPVASMEPDPDAVERIKNDPDRLQVRNCGFVIGLNPVSGRPVIKFAVTEGEDSGRFVISFGW